MNRVPCPLDFMLFLLYFYRMKKILIFTVMFLTATGAAAEWYDVSANRSAAADELRQREIDRSTGQIRDPFFRNPFAGIESIDYISVQTGTARARHDVWPPGAPTEFGTQSGAMISVARGVRITPWPEDTERPPEWQPVVTDETPHNEFWTALAMEWFFNLFITPVIHSASHFRGELEIARYNMTHDIHDDARGISFMANGFMDWFGDYRISPYIGAGIGAGHFTNTFSGGARMRPMFGFYGGFTFRILDNVHADLGGNIRMLGYENLIITGINFGIRHSF